MKRERAVSILAEMEIQSNAVQELYWAQTITIGTKEYEVSGAVESLRARIEIKSLTVEPLPEGLDELGKIEMLEAFRSHQWESQRIHLGIMKFRPFSGDWAEIGTVALLARDPFYVIDLMPYLTAGPVARIASGGRLGVRIVDAGYGLLTNLDKVVIFGDGTEELYHYP